MADYYPVLSRAIAGLEQSTAEARRAVYDRARTAIVKQLRSFDPPLSESDITRERLGLEDAIRRIEAEQRGAAGMSLRNADPVESVRQAAVQAESLGPATTAAQSRAAADRANLEGHAPAESQRIEPPFSSPSTSLPASEPIAQDVAEVPAAGSGARKESKGPGTEERGRGPAVFAIVAIVLLASLGAGAYVMRDRLSGAGGDATAVSEEAPPKISDRVAAGTDTPEAGAPTNEAEPARPFPPEPTPGTAPGDTTQQDASPPGSTTVEQPEATPSVAPVAQRSVLYEESPDQQAGTAIPGTAVWRLDTSAPNGAADPQIHGDIDVPNRNIKVTILVRRNTDATLPASHTVDMQFTLSPQFANGGVANVPGILFKPGEDAGGTALQGLSVKVMNSFFLVGLSNAANDITSNTKLMRESSWIDLPLLYENGRRAVLSVELGAPGQQAFAQALDAWAKLPPEPASSEPVR